jgi:formylglycine-generating enzyme required for sulfatase activity
MKVSPLSAHLPTLIGFSYLGLIGPPLAFHSGCASSGPKEHVPAPAAIAQSPRRAPPGVAGCAANQVPIPGGTFSMGSEHGNADQEPVHQVTLSAFCIDKTEVTVAAYRACVQAGKCRSPADNQSACTWGGSGTDQHPINCVDWNQANTFCAWAGGRLPTEAEWEYAARGSDGRKYPWGNRAPSPIRLNMSGTADGWERTAPVGSYPKGASPFGVLDMAGNVWEWTADKYYDEYSPEPETNPQNPGDDSSSRVARGGSWSSVDPAEVRAASRKEFQPDAKLGVRCARAAPWPILFRLVENAPVKKKKIAFVTGHGESEPSLGLQAIKEDIEQEYQIIAVNPSTAEIGTDVDALVVAGPQQSIDEKGQREIDKFLMSGRGAVILAPGMAVDRVGGRGKRRMLRNNDAGLSRLLESYGFKIGSDIVVDPEAAAPGAMEIDRDRRALVSLPAFVAAVIDQDVGLSIVEGVRGVIFPFASPVDLVGPLAGGNPPAGTKLWRLAASSKASFRHTGFTPVGPYMKFTPGKETGPFALGYAYQGVLKSAFATPQAAAAQVTGTQSFAESRKPVRLVVIGNAAFAHDDWTQLARFLPVYAVGAQLLYNAIAWTVEGEATVP